MLPGVRLDDGRTLARPRVLRPGGRAAAAGTFLGLPGPRFATGSGTGAGAAAAAGSATTAGSSGAAGACSAVACPGAAVLAGGTEDDGVAGELDLEPVARGQVELLPRGRGSVNQPS
jgi:hypothetical protein